MGICQAGHLLVRAFVSAGIRQCEHSSVWAIASVGIHQCGHSSVWAFVNVGIRQCRHSSVWAFVSQGICQGAGYLLVRSFVKGGEISQGLSTAPGLGVDQVVRLIQFFSLILIFHQY